MFLMLAWLPSIATCSLRAVFATESDCRVWKDAFILRHSCVRTQHHWHTAAKWMPQTVLPSHQVWKISRLSDFFATCLCDCRLRGGRKSLFVSLKSKRLRIKTRSPCSHVGKRYCCGHDVCMSVWCSSGRRARFVFIHWVWRNGCTWFICLTHSLIISVWPSAGQLVKSHAMCFFSSSNHNMQAALSPRKWAATVRSYVALAIVRWYAALL